MKPKKPYPTDLTNRQWKIIRRYLPNAKPGGRPRQLDLRQVLNGILYVLVGGVQWRLLPHCYPAWQSVYWYFRTWRDDGTWQRIHDALRASLRQRVGRHKHATAGSLDSRSVKSSNHPGVQGYDAHKRVDGRKDHLLVDTLGLLLALVVTAADLADPAGARLLLTALPGACKKLRLIWVDGAYRGTLEEWVSTRFRFRLRPVVRAAGQRGFVLLPRRWVVERTFAWLSAQRRLALDYEVLPQSRAAFIYIAMTRLMLRRLARS